MLINWSSISMVELARLNIASLKRTKQVTTYPSFFFPFSTNRAFRPLLYGMNCALEAEVIFSLW